MTFAKPDNNYNTIEDDYNTIEDKYNTKEDEYQFQNLVEEEIASLNESQFQDFSQIIL